MSHQFPEKLPTEPTEEDALLPEHTSRRKGIYILPNLITLAALFGGFYAIVMAMNSRFSQAIVGIAVAMIFDGLDGRVARLTHTQSAFGEQMDSLADMVSFGVAPALIAYEWSLKDLGRWGWIAAFVYCSCAALRLARFNVNTSVVDKRWFQGLPSPAAAGLVTSYVWMMNALINFQHDKSLGPFSWTQVCWATFVMTLYSGLTMTTNAPFYSFKDMSGRKSVPFATIVLIAVLIAIINIHPQRVLFALFLLYGISGYVIYSWRKAKGLPTSVISVSTDEPEERGLHQ